MPGKSVSSVIFVENESFPVTVSLSQKPMGQGQESLSVSGPASGPQFWLLFQASVLHTLLFRVLPFPETGWPVQADDQRAEPFLEATNRDVQSEFQFRDLAWCHTLLTGTQRHD